MIPIVICRLHWHDANDHIIGRWCWSLGFSLSADSKPVITFIMASHSAHSGELPGGSGSPGGWKMLDPKSYIARHIAEKAAKRADVILVRVLEIFCDNQQSETDSVSVDLSYSGRVAALTVASGRIAMSCPIASNVVYIGRQQARACL